MLYAEKRKRLNAEKRKQPTEEEAANPKPYKCRFCTKAFEKVQALAGHMNCHTQGKTM